MIARVVPKNIESYGIVIDETPHEKLYTICQQLHVVALEEKYSPKRRKKKDLHQLYQDPRVKTLLKGYVKRKMLDFLQVARHADVHLCLDVKREVRLEQIRLTWAQLNLAPQPYFEKMSAGIRYTLVLQKGDHTIVPKDHDVHILLDKPGYLILDYQIYSLEHINGNKIKPFLKQAQVLVPPHLTKTYFEKFIIDVVQNVDVEAKGFEITQIDKVQSISTSFTEDFMNNQYVLDLIFDYGGTFFYGSNPRQKRNYLLMDDNGQVTINQFIRSRKENDVAQSLIEAGLTLNPARRFTLGEKDGCFDLIQWAIEHKDFFRSLGIKLVPPVIDKRDILLEPADISLQTVTKQDWFDIKGVIVVGDFTLTFAQLLDSIRRDDPLYILPNNKVFIIPAAWMTTYQSLAKFGVMEGELVRIKKNQYTLLEESEQLSQGLRHIVIEESEVDYHGDLHLKVELRPYQLEGRRHCPPQGWPRLACPPAGADRRRRCRNPSQGRDTETGRGMAGRRIAACPANPRQAQNG